MRDKDEDIPLDNDQVSIFKEPKPKGETAQKQVAPAPSKIHHAIKQKSKTNEPATPPPLWMITFADIMAIMLTFFVLLYSMSVIEEDVWTDIDMSLTRGLSKGVSVSKGPKWYAGEQDTISIEKRRVSKALELSYLYNLVQNTIKDNNDLDGLLIIPDEDRLILSLPSDILFEAGQASMSLDGKKALFALGGILDRIKNRIEVIGHADPRPVSGENQAYTSNWQLSLSRAISVAAALEQVGYTKPVIARGLSSSRYDELPKELSEEQRLDLSRRVDIIIMKDDGDYLLF